MTSTNTFEITLADGAVAPTRGSKYAAGLDLYAYIPEKGQCVVVASGHRNMISTGVTMAIPEGYYGRVAPRSGLALKYGIDVMAGVVDSDFRSAVQVILYNTAKKEDFVVRNGDRIAQLILTPYGQHDPVAVKRLGDTERGQGGFGSTGV